MIHFMKSVIEILHSGTDMQRLCCPRSVFAQRAMSRIHEWSIELASFHYKILKSSDIIRAAEYAG